MKSHTHVIIKKRRDPRQDSNVAGRDSSRDRHPPEFITTFVPPPLPRARPSLHKSARCAAPLPQNPPGAPQHQPPAATLFIASSTAAGRAAGLASRPQHSHCQQWRLSPPPPQAMPFPALTNTLRQARCVGGAGLVRVFFARCATPTPPARALTVSIAGACKARTRVVQSPAGGCGACHHPITACTIQAWAGMSSQHPPHLTVPRGRGPCIRC